jgi:hypothetical protein
MAEAHPYTEYFLVCNNGVCNHRIPLPSSFPGVAWRVRAALPEAVPRENVVCPKCDRVYEYTRQRFDSHQSRKLAPYDQEQLTVATVSFLCEQGCGFLVQVHVPIPVGTSPEEIGELSKKWTLVDAHCLKGEPVLRIGPGYMIQTYFSATQLFR